MSNRAGRYSQSRKEEASESDAMANSYYKETWDVQRIVNIESMVKGHYSPNVKTLGLPEILDFSGADKIILTDSKTIFLSQRSRRWDSGNDFSLRMDNGTEIQTEYEKYIDSYKNVGFYPDVFAYGNLKKNKKYFESFYIIDFNKFLEEHLKGNISGTEHRGRGADKTAAKYFKPRQLKRAGCLIAKWE